ncbi:MAG TPA: tyrosine-type recombinase/integrase [Pyrinomonadaceae bacterium]|nr:tyrosine-type recombinase/integrase [Pyrinomonadaceae bacterium]
MARKSMQTRDGIYQRKDRAGFWISWTDAQGRRRYRKTDAQNITQAKQIRASEMLRAEQARVLGFSPPGEDTFAEVGARYLHYQKARLTPKAYEREESIMEKHLKPFFNCPLAGIRRQDVQRYVTQRSGKASPYSIQKELNVLKHLLRLAVEWELIHLNPAQGIKSPRVPAGRVRYLQPKELRAVVLACPEWLRPIAALAAMTGMRRGEIISLRWLDVDLSQGFVMLPQTKNGEGRIVYLNEGAQTILSSLPRVRESNVAERVFPNITADQVSTAFRRVCHSLNVVDFRFHDLRHTAASWLRMSGADIHTVAQLLGHKDLRMAARYQHLSPAFLSEAVGKLDAVFGELRYQDVTAPNPKLLGAAASG